MATQQAAEEKPIESLKPLSLRTNISWALAGNVVYSAFQWGMIIAIARLGTPEMVGQFTLGFAVTAPIILFMSLRLRLVQASDTNQDYIFQDYIALRTIMTFVGLISIVAVLVVVEYRFETALVILMIGIAKSAEGISDTFYGLFQQHERMNLVAFSTIRRGILGFIALAVALLVTENIVWASAAFALAWIICLFPFDAKAGQFVLKNTQTDSIVPRWNIPLLKKLIIMTLPLGVAAFLTSLTPNIPRYIIERSIGEFELGIFSSMAYFMTVGNLLVMAIGQASTHKLARYYKNNQKKAFYNLLFSQVGLISAMGASAPIVALVAGESILRFFYGAEYAQQADLFFWLMLAAGVTYVGSLLGYVFTAIGLFKLELFMVVATTLGTLLASFLLIPDSGLKGAAFALMIAGLIRLIASFIILGWRERRSAIIN